MKRHSPFVHAVTETNTLPVEMWGREETGRLWRSGNVRLDLKEVFSTWHLHCCNQGLLIEEETLKKAFTQGKMSKLQGCYMQPDIKKNVQRQWFLKN